MNDARLLVATTNVESSSTSVFRRSDDVRCSVPGPEEIEKLLHMTLSAVQLAEPINWKLLIDQLTGSSAAMTVKAAQDAAKAAVLHGKKAVTEALLCQAIGEQKKYGRPSQSD
jgi:ATP-dependent 26S proteasome regulatory subunit